MIRTGSDLGNTRETRDRIFDVPDAGDLSFWSEALRDWNFIPGSLPLLSAIECNWTGLALSVVSAAVLG
jgi:hypothetical protein